ncbi:phospholipase C, phosphocholine-specific [Alloacidobacterium dinghuense]|uniref:phospholipase C n=1 Tax=Alloacidobacterium dinghuense TaxID=2763107 RepID=A0A7G8BH00_9BACT|nr:phospholipase C, phosphocholine-specific [Alloacidobacterium dinghuense]QNI31820.1 phospholipase C, phosphocholine-specific [Alloacidobacterium dinghuense]
MSTNRRTFLKLLSSSALTATFPASISRALQIPASNRTGTIADVEHIVILMQENRSFDHYFGTLRGVRGFGDPRAVTLPSGKSVWHQPHGDSHILPFHPGAPNLGLQFLEDLPHDWTTTQQARNNGHYDQWIPAKGETTMAYLVRADIPYHYALADAFTICDAYHCSLLGPTDPNRYHMWTGWVGNDGQGGGPVVDNAEAGYTWSTFPERLEAAGISWKIYQDLGNGLTAKEEWGSTKDAYIGTYGDSSLLFFRQYQNAEPGSALHDCAKTGTQIANGGSLFDDFRKDVVSGNLPQVSWIVAPEAYTEHPNWPANYGAWYVSQILDALTSSPEVWSKTVFFLTYDENDGFFDHIVPPVPPMLRSHGLSTVDTSHEIFPGHGKHPAGPYGLGIRVPMLVISPWSKGGWVNSQVFDHTSLIRFIEERFRPDHPELLETNITPWRRAVCGDLTSAFDFSAPDSASISLPPTIAYVSPDNKRYPDYKPAPPHEQAMPAQEAGTRPARALPYELNVFGEADGSGQFSLQLVNTGKVAAIFQVRSGHPGINPRTYTVAPNTRPSDGWIFKGNSPYDLSVYGPNGFLRAFKGSLAGTSKAAIETAISYDVPGSGVVFTAKNRGAAVCNVRLVDAYTRKTLAHSIEPGEEWQQTWPLKDTFGWYDLTVEAESDLSFRHQLAGHLETGKDSTSDPAIGAVRT